MPQTVTITLTIPDGAQIQIGEALVSSSSTPAPFAQSSSQDIADYWTDYLSDNGRKIFEHAARIQDHTNAPFTLEDIAHNAGIDYESAKSMRITAGRSARKWRDDHNGTAAPIDLDWKTYSWDRSKSGSRTSYSLPEPVVHEILALIQP
ncbi:MAG: hypothetical protein WAP35_02195 [Solirubrobacterales bacterium]